MANTQRPPPFPVSAQPPAVSAVQGGANGMSGVAAGALDCLSETWRDVPMEMSIARPY